MALLHDCLSSRGWHAKLATRPRPGSRAWATHPLSRSSTAVIGGPFMLTAGIFVSLHMVRRVGVQQLPAEVVDAPAVPGESEAYRCLS